jgi:hypothetical protein
MSGGRVFTVIGGQSSYRYTRERDKGYIIEHCGEKNIHCWLESILTLALATCIVPYPNKPRALLLVRLNPYSSNTKIHTPATQRPYLTNT